MTTFDALTRDVRAFRDARDWAQFHTPRNLAVSVAIEAGELLECFQWADRPGSLSEVADEIADVMIYLLLLADTLGISPAQAVAAKMAGNERRYPVELAYGVATKPREG